MEKVLVIAEVGINHNGDLRLAKDLISRAHDAGADLVKFQKRDLSLCYTVTELEQPRFGPWGQTNGDLKRLLEFNGRDYEEIARHCALVGVDWTASVWDVPSQDRKSVV